MPIESAAKKPNDPALRIVVLFSIAGLGGAERSITRMALASDASDVRYELATMGEDGDWLSWVRSNGRAGRAFGLGLLRPWRLFGFVRTLRAIEPDVVYTVGARVYLLVRLIRWMLPSLRVVQALRAMYPPGSKTTERYQLVEKLFSPADAYIANSRAGARTYSLATGIPEENIHVIPNGIVVPQAAAPFEERVRHQVVLIANLIPGKGHLPFLEAAREVVRRIPDVKFIFVGRDDMNGAVQARARELGLDGCIRFAGYCADVAPWLDGSSLFVLPSAEEGAPTSILEAFAHGLPVVAYACGGIVEIVRDGVDGRVVQEISNEGMADAIVELLGDDSKRRAMGEAGRARMIGEYSLQACASRHADIWRRICGR